MLTARLGSVNSDRSTPARPTGGKTSVRRHRLSYWMELAAAENELLAFEPIKRTVPTTSTRITASMTAYSAMSWPESSDHSLRNILNIPASYLRPSFSRVRSLMDPYDDDSTPRCQMMKKSFVSWV